MSDLNSLGMPTHFQMNADRRESGREVLISTVFVVMRHNDSQTGIPKRICNVKAVEDDTDDDHKSSLNTSRKFDSLNEQQIASRHTSHRHIHLSKDNIISKISQWNLAICP